MHHSCAVATGNITTKKPSKNDPATRSFGKKVGGWVGGGVHPKDLPQSSYILVITPTNARRNQFFRAGTAGPSRTLAALVCSLCGSPPLPSWSHVINRKGKRPSERYRIATRASSVPSTTCALYSFESDSCAHPQQVRSQVLSKTPPPWGPMQPCSPPHFGKLPTTLQKSYRAHNDTRGYFTPPMFPAVCVRVCVCVV